MARKIADDTVPELREHLAAQTRAIIAKLEHSTQTELYDFTAEIERQRDRLIDIKAGRDVLVYRHEIPRAWQPPRDGQIVFTLRGDRLIPAVYEQVTPTNAV